MSYADESGREAGRLRFEVVDVFTDRAFSGNPLAVVYGSEGLSTEQLRQIAMEFNLSETTFPYAATDEERESGADYRVRIFTPTEEIPFAGHPTLGTAWSLCRAGVIDPGARRQLCGAGLIGVQVPDDAQGRVELSAAPRDHATALGPDESAAVASLVGLTAGDLVTAGYGAGCGLSWLYLQVSREALERSRPSGRKVSELVMDLPFLRDPYDGVAVYAVEDPSDPRSLHIEARVYVPGYGIPEDPATGSAAAGLGLVLVASGVAAAEGESAYTISQGVAMGRPSTLGGRVEATAGQATLVHVAGHVVPVTNGTIAIP
jgi:trans-2,3-dihydro-3-hydroxyanthranilate isomerase